jgi:hypothetical protein
MTAPLLVAVAVGSVLEETPEGLYALDELRRRAGEERVELVRLLSDEGLERLEAAELELERRILGL